MISPDQTLLWATLRRDLGLEVGNDFTVTAAAAAGFADAAAVMSVLTADPRRNDVDFGDELADARRGGSKEEQRD